MKNSKNAFSLIELSIVLIIIGLLVAGVTGGASLINSARLRALANELNSYKTALYLYYTHHHSLPEADSKNMSFSNTALYFTKLYDESIIDSKP